MIRILTERMYAELIDYALLETTVYCGTPTYAVENGLVTQTTLYQVPMSLLSREGEKVTFTTYKEVSETRAVDGETGVGLHQLIVNCWASYMEEDIQTILEFLFQHSI